MDDQELLMRAAKAAGLEPFTAWGKTFVMGDGSPPRREWNPLTDDGDALRLAVMLGLAVSVEYQVGSTVVLWGPPTGSVREPHGGDAASATRRAIVRAAAEQAA